MSPGMSPRWPGPGKLSEKQCQAGTGGTGSLAWLSARGAGTRHHHGRRWQSARAFSPFLK